MSKNSKLLSRMDLHEAIHVIDVTSRTSVKSLHDVKYWRLHSSQPAEVEFEGADSISFL